MSGQSGQRKKRFLAAYVNTGTITGGANAIGLRRGTVYDWLAKDDKFAADFEQVQDMVADNLEEEAIRRAYSGSDTMLIFLLKGLKPERYGERREHTLKGEGDKPIMMEFTIGNGFNDHGNNDKES